ncbi:diaminopimelate epimerase [Vallitalea guaymasensis]|uniref:Diaminopimelate epimerase n=1 Tax=Vallitalea guaymasensis TaxID=1185412 RepID=A0A8J8M915_9FIRM|nr:diaminopimelate epimerase [Vallitalea guaymasensis]QUH28355.1 diaminopimelate epimerase [Vallitalea guaymasensis]
MKFTKMHGCGNDYIYINGFQVKVDNPAQLSIKMSNRHFGVGSDGIVLILPSDVADFRMRMFNSDGSEAEMCGNAIRCVGKYVYDNKMTDKTSITIETLAGIKILDMTVVDEKVTYAKVDMGEPILKAEDIPVISDKSPVIGEEIDVNGKTFEFTCVSMGNPHAIAYVDDTDTFEVEKIGKLVEIDEKFPKKVNVEFAQIIDNETIKMRVWERGSGETLACGTGACATLVASVLNNLTDRKAVVKLIGGDLLIEWDKESNHIYMSGEAVTTFEGEWLL